MKCYKKESEANPISSIVYCADPTAVEYNGRLYVYGTNDHEQYENSDKNTYEKIKSLVCFSTDDMTNWTYHGTIDVGSISPWIINSWAPSICSRVEEDGLTHFYMYYSNSGCGVGVITATNPEGPWSDPLGKPLIDFQMKGLENVPNPFDPGVCIDDKGTGWLSFGGGISPNGTKAMPGTSRVVKLGKDMISTDSDYIEINAPNFYEASELNFVDGTYVYTFNSNWEPGSDCSMNYMTTKTPLVSDSWIYKGKYFKNPGRMGFDDSNNHTHFHQFKGEWYIFYHSLCLQRAAGVEGGFRSLCVNKLNLQSGSEVVIKDSPAYLKGVSSIKNLNPFETVKGSTFSTSAEVSFNQDNLPEALSSCSWIFVKNADFTTVPAGVLVEAEGQGTIQIFADAINNAPLATVKLSNKKVYEEAVNLKIKGIHNLYFVFSEPKISLKSWRFW